MYPAVTPFNLSTEPQILYADNVPDENGVTKEILGLFSDDYHCLLAI